MKFHHSYKLTSEHRKSPMMLWSKGMDFPWESLRDDIASDTFAPKNYDMLHALNWMKRHIGNVAQAQPDKLDYAERLCASEIWCALYPFAPLDVQAHMVIMLHDAPLAHTALMQNNSSPWCTALEKAWLRREDMPLWKAVSRLLPLQSRSVHLVTDILDHALLLLRPSVHAWIKDSTLNTPLSDMVYKELFGYSGPQLKEKLDTFRLLYPDLNDMPKSDKLLSGWDTYDTSDSAERMKLDHCKQLAANLVLFNTQHETALTLPTMDLPANVFESLP